MEKKIKLTIDNRPVRVAPGTTILDAAESVGIAIPTLCHIDLKGTCVKNNPASCRIGNKRMLEILGTKGYSNKGLTCLWFRNPDKSYGVLLLNENGVEAKVVLTTERSSVTCKIPPHAIQSVSWKD